MDAKIWMAFCVLLEVLQLTIIGKLSLLKAERLYFFHNDNMLKANL